MRIPGLGRARLIVRNVRDGFSRKAAILTYHRVADAACDPWELCVSPENFAAQMQVLQRYRSVFHLDEIVSVIRSGGRLPPKACVVTFDDGYADNLYAAEPLLAAHRIPATIFMTSGSVGRAREFWWDELEKVFLQPGKLPRELRLRIDSQDHHWELYGGTDYTDAAFRLHRDWREEDAKPPTDRQRIYHSVYYLLQQLPRETRDPIIDEIVDWAGASRAVRPTHRALTSEEAQQLTGSQWITIGAHTVTHQSLSRPPAAVQREEIAGSKAQLEQLLGIKVNTFSYPYGQHTDLTTEIVEEAGFTCACACLEKSATIHSPLYRLPRLMVRNWNAELFERRLASWLV